MNEKNLDEILWGKLHTVTLAHENEPNEPHRQVIFKEEIPGIILAIRQWAKSKVPTGKHVESHSSEGQFGFERGFNAAIEQTLKNLEGER